MLTTFLIYVTMYSRKGCGADGTLSKCCSWQEQKIKTKNAKENMIVKKVIFKTLKNQMKMCDIKKYSKSIIK